MKLLIALCLLLVTVLARETSPPSNPCDSFPCLNGGQCSVDAAGGFTCTCLGCSTGPTCGTYINHCQNGGTCVPDSTGAASCNCVDCWGGDDCSESTLASAPDFTNELFLEGGVTSELTEELEQHFDDDGNVIRQHLHYDLEYFFTATRTNCAGGIVAGTKIRLAGNADLVESFYRLQHNCGDNNGFLQMQRSMDKSVRIRAVLSPEEDEDDEPVVTDPPRNSEDADSQSKEKSKKSKQKNRKRTSPLPQLQLKADIQVVEPFPADKKAPCKPIRILAIPVNLQNVSIPADYTEANIRDTLFTRLTSTEFNLRLQVHENFHDRLCISESAVITEQFTINRWLDSNRGDSGVATDWAEQVDLAVGNAYNYDDFDHIVYLFGPNTGSKFNNHGQANLCGLIFGPFDGRCRIWLYGTARSESTWNHELLHSLRFETQGNVGGWHAGITQEENSYDDFSDPLGKGGEVHMAAVHKIIFDVVPQFRIAVASKQASQNFNLISIEQNPYPTTPYDETYKQVVAINVGDGSYTILSYRALTSNLQQLPVEYREKLNVHIYPAERPKNEVDSIFVTALADGECYIDKTTDTVYGMISHGADTAEIRTEPAIYPQILLINIAAQQIPQPNPANIKVRIFWKKVDIAERALQRAICSTGIHYKVTREIYGHETMQDLSVVVATVYESATDPLFGQIFVAEDTNADQKMEIGRCYTYQVLTVDCCQQHIANHWFDTVCIEDNTPSQLLLNPVNP